MKHHLVSKILSAALASMLIFCGCGNTVDENQNNAVSSAASDETAATQDHAGSISSIPSENNNTDLNTEKSSKRKTFSSKSSSRSNDSDSKADTDLSKKNNKSAGSTVSRIDSKTESKKPIADVAPQNVQQYIIEEPVIVVGPEPDSTFENKYENVPPEMRVDDSWFDDCVIIGDSLTVGLSLYNDRYNVFGNAQFICAASLGYWNCQWDLYDPYNVHPFYKGRKILVEDAAVLTGAKKAIITLGMNDIGMWGSDGVIYYAESLLKRIREKSPDLKIYLQTVTPMIYARQKEILNNDLIRQFNENLRELAKRESCGFLDSYDALANSNGNLPVYLCSDPDALGLHLNFDGCAVWTDFLKANIKNALPESDVDSNTDIDTDLRFDSDTDTETDCSSDIDTDSNTGSDISDTDFLLSSDNTDTELPDNKQD